MVLDSVNQLSDDDAVGQGGSASAALPDSKGPAAKPTEKKKPKSAPKPKASPKVKTLPKAKPKGTGKVLPKPKGKNEKKTEAEKSEPAPSEVEASAVVKRPAAGPGVRMKPASNKRSTGKAYKCFYKNGSWGIKNHERQLFSVSFLQFFLLVLTTSLLTTSLLE